MNWDQIAGEWKQFKGKVKEKWGKLTDDELTTAAGKREQLAGLPGKVRLHQGPGREGTQRVFTESKAVKLADQERTITTTMTPKENRTMATTTKHPASETHLQAAAHHAAAAHHHLEAAHHHDMGEHDQAKKHAEAAIHHSEQGHKHTTTAHQHSHK
jgi:uncharacterized protein YjbJ (UPF0337 family)